MSLLKSIKPDALENSYILYDEVLIILECPGDDQYQLSAASSVYVIDAIANNYYSIVYRGN